MPNGHVRAYLKAYLKRKDPSYAILLTAPWGAGKTHLVQRLMKGEDALYVSLFGVKDSDDIDRAILLRRMNLLDNAWSKGIGRLGAVAWKYLKMPELKPAEFAKLALPDTLVFDDLERTNMPVGELAGYLNSFVEHEGKRLILLANEDELWGGESRRIKEKLVGHTLVVRPDITAALPEFLKAMEGDARNFLEAHRAIIEKVFAQSTFGATSPQDWRAN